MQHSLCLVAAPHGINCSTLYRPIAVEPLEPYLTRTDNSADQNWALVEWVMDKGASEFALDILDVEGTRAQWCDDVERKLLPFRLGSRPRERLTARVDNTWIRPTGLWTLNARSVALLKNIFDGDPFTYPCGNETGWVEDPTFYRDSKLVFGIVSHEDYGVLRVDREGLVELEQRGIKLRTASE